MTPLALLTYPNIDPVAIELGPISVKWYGLAYMAGLVLGWLYIRRLVTTPKLWSGDKPPLTLERVDDLLLYITGAVIIGGRLGQVLLYDPEFYFSNPAEIIKVWKGGMSFHGALIASGILIVVFARAYKVSARSVMDLCCAAVPFGLFFGRIANFIIPSIGAGSPTLGSEWYSPTAATTRAIRASSMKQRSKALSCSSSCGSRPIICSR